jgi:hypothetical protein
VQRSDFDAFLPDDHMLDLVTLGLLQEIRTLATRHEVRVIFALLDRLDPAFNRKVLEQFDVAVDVSTPLDHEFSFLPDDIHPNPKAHRIYAAGVGAAIASLGWLQTR